MKQFQAARIDAELACLEAMEQGADGNEGANAEGRSQARQMKFYDEAIKMLENIRDGKLPLRDLPETKKPNE